MVELALFKISVASFISEVTKLVVVVPLSYTVTEVNIVAMTVEISISGGYVRVRWDLSRRQSSHGCESDEAAVNEDVDETEVDDNSTLLVELLVDSRKVLEPTGLIDLKNSKC